MAHIIQNPQYTLQDIKNLPKDTVIYSDEENKTWQYLYNNQLHNLQEIGYSKILKYIKELALPNDRIPQLNEVSEVLYKRTGWQVCKVDNLIDSEYFFQLLSERKFPSTIIIRNNEEALLSKDPDIFHELFGHCPILLDKEYATLFEKIGATALKFDQIQRGFLQRIFWFTFETGLVNTIRGLKIYGGSLLSSIQESRYAIKSNEPIRKQFDVVNIFRTSYRADLLQPIYYIISDFFKLHALLDNTDEIKKNMDLAYNLGEYYPLFPIQQKYIKYMNYNICKFIHEKSSSHTNVT